MFLLFLCLLLLNPFHLVLNHVALVGVVSVKGDQSAEDVLLARLPTLLLSMRTPPAVSPVEMSPNLWLSNQSLHKLIPATRTQILQSQGAPSRVLEGVGEGCADWEGVRYLQVYRVGCVVQHKVC